MKFKLIKSMSEGERLPPYHGVATYDYTSNLVVSAIVPLNWVIATAYAVWSFLRFGSKSIASSPHEAYRQGVSDRRKRQFQ